MRISIIIPTMRDNISYLKCCVDSIKKYLKEDHEIIVISNPDPYYEIPIKGIKRLHSSKQGQCVSVNMGVREAKNDYVLISDDDVVFSPNWEELLEKAKETEFLSGNFVESGKKGGVAMPFITKDFGDNPDNFDWEAWEKSEDLREDKWENGFGFPLICKKDFWEKIEGYDEEYDPWGSNVDSDLEYKVMLAGVMPRRWRGAPTYHFAQVSGIFTRPEAQPYWQKNRAYFERKWGLRRADPPTIWYCDFVINKNKLLYKPKWMKDTYVKPVPIQQNIKLDHVGWITSRPDLFEKFWCDIIGFKKIWESVITGEMSKELFGWKEEMICRRYQRGEIKIEIHITKKKGGDYLFTRYGINHICLWVDDRIDFIRSYDFDVKIYNNPKGHQNIFIRDFEGNWIELKQKL